MQWISLSQKGYFILYNEDKITFCFKKGCFIGPQNQRFRLKKGCFSSGGRCATARQAMVVKGVPWSWSSLSKLGAFHFKLVMVRLISLARLECMHFVGKASHFQYDVIKWEHSALLFLYAGNPSVTGGGFPSQRDSNTDLWCYFVVSLNTLNKHSIYR